MKRFLKWSVTIILIVGLTFTIVLASTGNNDLQDDAFDNNDGYEDEFTCGTGYEITFDENLTLEEILDGIEDIKKEDLEKLEKLYDKIVNLEKDLDKASNEFEVILDKYIDEDEINEELDDVIPSFDEIISEVDGIEKEDLSKLKTLYNKAIELEKNEKYDESDKLWEEFESILYKYFDEDDINEDMDIPEEDVIASYNIKDGNILLNDKPQFEDKELIKFQNNNKAHEAIWEKVKSIVPSKYLKYISQFQIFTDGKEETLAMVAPQDDNNDKWIFSVDIADSLNKNGKLNEKELSYTLIHEFGHILTLNNTQIENIKQNESNINRYSTMEGITKDTSYLNQFYNTFWKDIYDEWQKIEDIEDEDKYYDALDNFYQKYQSRFVSDYASTNPGEDIAETFADFVTKEKPEGNTIAEKKILFFYKYPELLKLREEIRKAS